MGKLVFLIVVLNCCYMQQIKHGTYLFKNNKVSEELVLNPDYTFDYSFYRDWLRIYINGSWSVCDDNLILNSIPRKDKMKVKESKGTNKYYTLNVESMDGREFFYYIFLKWDDGKETIHEDQWGSTKLKKKVKLKSFYIVDSKGLKSPVYEVKDFESRNFDVKVEKQRMFIMEKWKIDGSEITPRMFDGELAKYTLSRQN
jgi:hypothetical protein